jgi:DUF971 family protein
MTMSSEPWPLDVAYSASRRILTITYDNGTTCDITAEALRVATTSAEAKGHGGVGGTPVVGKENVSITAIEPVGRYALRLVFDDGHRTGLYTWAHLYELGVRAKNVA